MDAKVGRGLVWALLVCFVVGLAGWSRDAYATPGFARKQNLGCPVCHTVYPLLNEVGRQFKENGFRFPDGKDRQKVSQTGPDLGNGIVLDPFPGISVKLSGAIASYLRNENGKGSSLSTTPLDSLETVMAGSNGAHFSYFAEFEASADAGFAVESPNGLVQYRFAPQLSAYAGWTPTWSRDGYNTISEARRVDNVDHALDFTGSTGINFSDNSAILGVYGQVGKVWYNGGVTPGPGVLPGTEDPLDAFGRVEFDITRKIGVGGFLYSGNVARPGHKTASTMRAALDFNGLTDFGTFTLVGMYDSKDSAILGEAGWTLRTPAGHDLFLVPEARFDFTESADGTIAQPTLGFGVQHSAGRVLFELSDAFGGGDVTPNANLTYVAIF